MMIFIVVEQWASDSYTQLKRLVDDRLRDFCHGNESQLENIVKQSRLWNEG